MEAPYYFIFCLTFLAVARGITLDDCPPAIGRGAAIRAFGTSCYMFVFSHTREFAAAERECESHGGHLVIIRDAFTQNFLYRTMRNEFLFGGQVFIGYTDEQSEGHWIWVDGSIGSYTHWANGQPGFASSTYDCAVIDMSDGGQWHDKHCESHFFGVIKGEYYFICEYPLPTTTTTTTTILVTTTTTSTSTTTTSMATSPTTTALTTTATEKPETSSDPELVTMATTMMTTPEPTTPTTPEPTAPTKKPEPMTTAMPQPDSTHTNHASHTTHQHSGHAHDSTTVTTTAAATTAIEPCPPFECGLDCGLDGYILNPAGCMLCQCE